MEKKNRYLYLMRHGQAVPSRQDNDFNRPLNQEGIQKILSQIEVFKRTDGIRPDCILCSTAKRAKQTVQILQNLFEGIPVFFRDGLYLAPPYRMMDIIQETDDVFRRMMIIGHNPGLEQLTSLLVAGQYRLSPSGCIAIELPVSHWREIKMGMGQIQKIF